MGHPCRRTAAASGNKAKEIRNRKKPAGKPIGGLFRVRLPLAKHHKSDANRENEPIIMMESNGTIDFEKMDGLVPGVVQDARTGEVLMLGFLNPVSYAQTLETGFVTFWSRTRQKLWRKGETSGNRLRVVSAATDCDNDTLLFRVEVEGDGLVCHEGTISCFTRSLELSTAGTQTEVARG